MSALISVLLPCYNAAATLDASISSVMHQTCANFELLAVDDGSTDATRAQLERWAERDQRVHVLHQRHQGIIPALNHATSLARGCYLARMDADDWAYPERLAAQLAVLETQPDVAVVGSLVRATPVDSIRPGLADYLSWINTLYTHDAIMRSLYIESPLVHPSVMLRRTWLERVGGYVDHGWPEDYDLWMRLAQAGARFAKVPRVLLDWHNHADRLTWSDPRYQRSEFLRLKAHYLQRMLLPRYERVIMWGAGSTGKRLSRLLLAGGAPLDAFIDADPRKAHSVCHGLPVHPPAELRQVWSAGDGRRSVVLVAVAVADARSLIAAQLVAAGLVETHDWWFVA